MSKVVLSKSGLQKERAGLHLYRKVLPSLDLKRRQLMGEQKRAERSLADLDMQIESLLDRVAAQIPMLGSGAVDIDGVLTIKEIRRNTENVVGVRLPSFVGVDFETIPYSLLGKPHWVDITIAHLQEYATLCLRAVVAKERLDLLNHSVRKITQRVNLFEKILIPTAEKNIRGIQIYLADAERTAVIQSKLSKAKRLAAAHPSGIERYGTAP